MSRPLATIITFFISALAHELVMACITKKFRGYGFTAMMLQLPIVMVQRAKWVRGRKLFNVCSSIVPAGSSGSLLRELLLMLTD